MGALFLIAMVTSLVGATLIDSILSAPDYLANVSANRTTVTGGVFLELINGIAVIGIAVLMYPLFKKQNEALATGYVALRIMESVAIVAAVVSPLSLIALSQDYVKAGASAATHLEAVGASLLAERALWVGAMIGIFFGLAALPFFWGLFRSRLVPRYISIWGLLAAVSVLTWNLLEFFGISVSFGMILALPIIVNEVFLAIWLIVKGFNPSAIASPSAT